MAQSLTYYERGAEEGSECASKSQPKPATLDSNRNYENIAQPNSNGRGYAKRQSNRQSRKAIGKARATEKAEATPGKQGERKTTKLTKNN